MATAPERLRSRAERVPPHNEDAEQAVLGAMMLSGEAIAQVADLGLTAEGFYRRAHRTIFESLTEIYARGEPVDQVTTVEELRRKDVLDAVGGALYIQTLLETVDAPASAPHHARIVEHALLRRLIDAAGE